MRRLAPATLFAAVFAAIFAASSSSEAIEIENVARGPRFYVALTLRANRDYQLIPLTTRETLEGWMRIFEEDGPDHLPPDYLKE